MLQLLSLTMQPKHALTERANNLVHRLADGCVQKHGFGQFSPTIYDTAWLALVQKHVNGESRWLFPECFQFLLDNQNENGTFGVCTTDIDVILNTAAALIALLRHSKLSLDTDPLPIDIDLRISRSREVLNARLASWDVETSDHVGFEILVPALLRFLEEEEVDGVCFEFPQKEALMVLNQKKLAGFNPHMLYGQHMTTLVHSMEAFVGQIDFGKVAHQKSFGSMMGSPSSTAAYLMNAPTWDEEAEEYLRNVIQFGKGQESGGVPSAYPTTVFEISWVSLNSKFTTKSVGLVHKLLGVVYLVKQE